MRQRPQRADPLARPLRDHRRAGLEGKYRAIARLIRAGSRAHIEHRASIAQGRRDQRAQAGILPASGSVSVADADVARRDVHLNRSPQAKLAWGLEAFVSPHRLPGFAPAQRRASAGSITYQGTSILAFCTDLNRKRAFAKEHEPDLAAVGAGKDFQAKLETKLRALETDSGAERDGAAIASLPDNKRAFCEAKGRLYYAIKDIINAARALHDKEPEAAAKYNLKVLYRRGGKGKAEVVPVVAPTPAK